MNKKERVLAAIKRQPVDCVPCSFSLHFPKASAYGEAGIQSHLRFFKDTDTDILKIMNENLVPYMGEIRRPEDFALIKAISVKDDFMRAQLETTERILEASDSSAFRVGTLHGALASTIHPLEKMGMPYERTREVLAAALREKPQPVLDAMRRVADGMSELASRYIELGLDGVYYAALGAERRYFTDEEFAEWIVPFDRQILSSVKDAGGYTILHMCKDGLNMNRYAQYLDLSDVVNWGVYEAPYSLEEGARLFPGKTIMGGFPNRTGVLAEGTPEQVKAETRRLLSSFGTAGFIVGADCTLATEQNLANVRAVAEACRE